MQSQSGQLRILNNAGGKIKKFYQKDNPNRQYYLDVLEARGSDASLVGPSGDVSTYRLGLVENALIRYLKMYRGGVMAPNINGSFIQRLDRILKTDAIRQSLKTLRSANILLPNLNQYQSDAQLLYNGLSVSGPRSLAVDGSKFCVGATKIMHCLFPEFFIMLDSHVAEALHNEGYLSRKSGYNNFSTYWKGMQTCHDELQAWCKIYGDANSLLQLDPQRPTTLVRIFDICCWQ